MNLDYTNCSWFHEFANAEEPDPDLQIVDKTNFLTDNQTKRFLERYFDAYYVLDSGSQPRNDLCILRHSNGICVIGLAPGNHIFEGCYPNGFDNKNTQPVSHRILGLDFQISDQINRLRNHVQGRRKHGGHILQTPDDVIAYAVCDQGFRHPIYSAIPGRLLEVNTTMAIPNQLTDSSELPCHPNSTRAVTPLGGSSIDLIASYTWILLPYLFMKQHSRTNRLPNQPNLSNSCPSESDDLVDFELVNSNHVGLPKHCDFGSKLADIFKLNVVNWDEYCKLRNLKN